MLLKIGLTTTLALLPLYAASAQKCSDTPLRITFHDSALLSNWDGTASGSSVPSTIVGDGNDVYTNGQTTGATIKCSSGTHDAVLNLLTGKRHLNWNLPAPIPASGATLQTPPPATYSGNGVFSVHNIVCNGCASPGQPFVTRISSSLQKIFNGHNFGLQYLPAANPSTLPAAADLDNDSSQVATANSPNATSWAVVLPQPYNCAQGIYPSWIVRGTLPNTTDASSSVGVASLFDSTTNLYAGQFSMPFEVQIQALQCITPY